MENKVLAVVNGIEVTESDLSSMLAKFPKERQGYLASEEGKAQLLEQIISFELLYSYAKDNGIEQDKNYISQLEMVKKEILTQTAINNILAGVTVTDQEVKDYYTANKEMFKTEESASAKHILVDTLEKAEEVSEKIKNGMSFEEAANEYSSCPSKEQGGNLGSFTRGRMVPEFEDAAFKLGVGVVSEPVKTQFGYHLIKVYDKKESSARPLEEVAPMIKSQLLQERQSFKYMQFTEGLKDKYKVEIK